jgi:ABC-type cobalamin/Fe3+-siderophores transport system ATPase subunit
MILKDVYIRFYKSFNYDYLRKFNKDVTDRFPWEFVGEKSAPDRPWYPYVRVNIEQDVTTIVGANEAGKSQLLGAIYDGLRGIRCQNKDFCRYSPFFSVEEGKMMEPQFGFHWVELDVDERQRLQDCFKITTAIEDIRIFRPSHDRLIAYLPQGKSFSEHEALPEEIEKVYKLFPEPWKIDPKLVIPNSIPIRSLLSEAIDHELTSFEKSNRKSRYDAMEKLDTLLTTTSYSTEQDVKNQSASIQAQLQELKRTLSAESTQNGISLEAAKLTNDLICLVGGVDRLALVEIYGALRTGEDAYANGLIEKVNRNLTSNLNFRRWWSQDRAFKLSITAREQDIVFTIRDRTNTDYGFSERSSGLQNFLSYYIQYRAHHREDAKREILLMDEPDAYLSSQAQQDLLKVFDAFAKPDMENRLAMQVVFVTHSPFLIDKNRGHRIRVLEKGVDEEGTRVVRDASRNHYEPLRSSLGAFVAETTFIGQCNIMLEGISDQVILAGIASYMHKSERPISENLDLNSLTLVPAGSSSHIPYMVHLAIGRDIEKPAVIAFLDSDKGGEDARKLLLKGPPKYKELLPQKFIISIASIDGIISDSGEKLEIEDIIPLELYVRGVRPYLSEVCRFEDDLLSTFNTALVLAFKEAGRSLYDMTNAALRSLVGAEFKLDKVAAARGLIDYLRELYSPIAILDEQQKQLLGRLESNCALIFKTLNFAKDLSIRELALDRMSSKIKRLLSAFVDDHKTPATREECKRLLDDILDSLDDSKQSNQIKHGIADIILEFDLEIDQVLPVRAFDDFKERITRLQHLPRILTQEPTLTANPGIPQLPIPSPVLQTPLTSTQGASG